MPRTGGLGVWADYSTAGHVLAWLLGNQAAGPLPQSSGEGLVLGGGGQHPVSEMAPLWWASSAF